MSLEHPVIEIRNLVKIFGSDASSHLNIIQSGGGHEDVSNAGGLLALKNIDLPIERGKICVIMGLSGSGKSTLLRCINRLVNPTGGQILIDGIDITHMPIQELRQLRAKKMGMVFQHFALFPHLSVIDNVAFGLRIMGVSKAERHQRAEKVLTLVGLTGWGNRKPRELSGGMRQRVGLARALVMDTPILLMDEPFSALDPIIRDELQQELLRLQGELNKTIVFVTHDPNEAVTLGDHIIILRRGEIVQQGKPREIMSSPANDYVANFMKGVALLKVLTAGQLIDSEFKPIEPLSIQSWLSSRDSGEPFAAVIGTDGRLAGIVRRNECASESKSSTEHISQDFTSLSAEEPIARYVPELVRGTKCIVVEEDGVYRGMLSRNALLRAIESDPSIASQTSKTPAS